MWCAISRRSYAKQWALQIRLLSHPIRIVESDLPTKKTDFIKGEYELTLPCADAKVAVKIVDMLGEEVIEVA